MNHSRKKYIKYGIIIPIIAAVVAVLLFFAVFSVFKDEFPFMKTPACFADYDEAKVLTAEQVDLGAKTVQRKDISEIADNTVIGSIRAKGNELELIYGPNSFNAIGRCALSSQGKLFGETGTVLLSCYKADSEFVKALEIGDEVKADVNYGSYAYEVIDIKTVKDTEPVDLMGDGIGRAMVLYTDVTKSKGISNTYIVVICRMTDGVEIIG